MPRKRYEGEALTVTFDMKRCVHARNCFLKLPDVFDPSRRPWVDPDAAPVEEITAMIRTCPSGALAFERRDGGPEERPAKINRVVVRENGPLEIAGDVQVEGEHTTRATLCRCGLSKNKPWCDHTHAGGGFEATGEPSPSLPRDPSEAAEGTVDVSRRPDGPLRLAGSFELVRGSGGRIGRCDGAMLCRCGHSGNKPFCDGTHAKAGFVDSADG